MGGSRGGKARTIPGHASKSARRDTTSKWISGTPSCRREGLGSGQEKTPAPWKAGRQRRGAMCLAWDAECRTAIFNGLTVGEG